MQTDQRYYDECPHKRPQERPRHHSRARYAALAAFLIIAPAVISSCMPEPIYSPQPYTPASLGVYNR